MNYTVCPYRASGRVTIPSSKSCLHRLIICSALSGRRTLIHFDGYSKDIEATVSCLRAMGAEISVGKNEMITEKFIPAPGHRELFCGESGSTLRFLLPVVGAMGLSGVFHTLGRLAERPLEPLMSELVSHGMKIEKSGSDVSFSGKLRPGRFTLPGNISSQFISGLLFALPLLDDDSEIEITEKIESGDYINITLDALNISGVKTEKNGSVFTVRRGNYSPPAEMTAEGDWSGAAFFICMGAMSHEGLTVRNLNPGSLQGDKKILDIVSRAGGIVTREKDGVKVKKGGLRPFTADAAQIPDLVPVLAVLAAAADGESRIINAGRLRLKESDRIKTACSMINSLGGRAEETADGIIIYGKGSLRGGRTGSFGDHRIAMSAAVAAGLCAEETEIIGAECVDKSFPDFWNRFEGVILRK